MQDIFQIENSKQSQSGQTILNLGFNLTKISLILIQIESMLHHLWCSNNDLIGQTRKAFEEKVGEPKLVVQTTDVKMKVV